MKIRYSGVTPLQQTAGAAGMDLVLNITEGTSLVLNPGERELAPTGLYIEIPEGFVGFVTPRSGLAARQGLTVVNSPGAVDSDYRGEVKVILLNTGDETIVLEAGSRIAQLIIMPVPAVELVQVSLEELSSTERGEGGMGSTGV